MMERLLGSSWGATELENACGSSWKWWPVVPDRPYRYVGPCSWQQKQHNGLNDIA